ncbi:MAG: hypothetical protein ACRD4R_14460 [Candidatus Acidiferrales bacterium]
MKKNCILVAALCFLALSLAHVASAQNAKVAGTWELSSPGRNGTVRTSTLTLQQDGAKLSGTMKTQRGSNPLTGTVSGNNVAFSVSITTPNGALKLDYTGTADGDAMKGTLSVMGNTINWTAKRTGGGGAGN